MGFKENLKSELEYANILVKELSAKSGVSKSSLDTYLNNRSKLPSAMNALKIAQALNTTVEYLLTGKEPTYKPNNSSLSPKIKTIAKLTSKLNEAEQDNVLLYVKFLLAQKTSH